MQSIIRQKIHTKFAHCNLLKQSNNIGEFNVKKILQILSVCNYPADDLKTDTNQLRRIMFFVIGGPGSGKTTLLNNLGTIMKQRGENLDSMVKIGSQLCEALKSPQPNIDSILKNGNILLIDNRGSSETIINLALGISKKYKYRTILIHPHIDKITFGDRIKMRKIETGREYDFDIYWKEHQLFANYLMKNIINSTVQESLFDAVIIYDNRFDDAKDLIFVKINDQPYVLNDHKFYNSLLKKTNSNITNKIKTCGNNKIKTTHIFIDKNKYLTLDLMHFFNLLFDDLYDNNNNFDNLLGLIKVNNYL